MIHRRLIAKGIKYYLTLPHNTGHGIHSPFLFRLINEVFAKDMDYEALRKIENYRQSLNSHSGKLVISDLGALSNRLPVIKKVKTIAEKESISHHYGKLLYNLAREFNPANTIELGTCLGVGTLYLALGNPGGKVISIEGSPEKSSLASSMLQKYAPNAEVITGNFDDQLPEVLQSSGKADLVFIDGNHKKEFTLKYLDDILVYSHDDTVLIFDDINWSPEMMEAWRDVQNHPKTRVCLDLFRIGIVLLNPKLQKESFTIFY
jgi:predicted O-methyltransferase YrrM